MAKHDLTLGEVVKLKRPYRPKEWVEKQQRDWNGFEFGIVAEFEDQNKVSLFLYDADGQLLVTPSLARQTLLIPTYIEFDIADLVFYEIVTESGLTL
jgi:hypothetical protein